MGELIWTVRLGLVLVVFAMALLLYAGFRWRRDISNFIARRRHRMDLTRDSTADHSDVVGLSQRRR